MTKDNDLHYHNADHMYELLASNGNNDQPNLFI